MDMFRAALLYLVISELVQADALTFLWLTLFPFLLVFPDCETNEPHRIAVSRMYVTRATHLTNSFSFASVDYYYPTFHDANLLH